MHGAENCKITSTELNRFAKSVDRAVRAALSRLDGEVREGEVFKAAVAEASAIIGG